MFRRGGKNSGEDATSLYQDENQRASSYVYNQKISEVADAPPRIFDKAGVSPLPLSTDLEEKTSHLPHPFPGILKEEIPETTLGEGVSFRGELSFERLLRIDGTFEGTLLSQGKVIVGPQGKVKADLHLREAIIEGEIEGNIHVLERLELRGDAKVKGDIRAKALSVDEGVQILGHVNVSITETPAIN